MGRGGGSQVWGRPGAKAARGGGREGTQRSGPAPPLTRFSSSSSSGTSAAAATTSHCLLQLSSGLRTPSLLHQAALLRPLQPPIGQGRCHSSVAL